MARLAQYSNIGPDGIFHAPQKRTSGPTAIGVDGEEVYYLWDDSIDVTNKKRSYANISCFIQITDDGQVRDRNGHNL